MEQQTLFFLEPCRREEDSAAFTHLYGVQHPAEVHAQVGLCHVQRVREVQRHRHVPYAHSLLVHCFILREKAWKLNKKTHVNTVCKYEERNVIFVRVSMVETDDLLSSLVIKMECMFLQIREIDVKWNDIITL